MLALGYLYITQLLFLYSIQLSYKYCMYGTFYSRNRTITAQTK